MRGCTRLLRRVTPPQHVALGVRQRCVPVQRGQRPQGALGRAGFDSDWDCRGTIIQYNYSHDNGGRLPAGVQQRRGAAEHRINDARFVRYNVSVNDGCAPRKREAKATSHRLPHQRSGKRDQSLQQPDLCAEKAGSDIDRTMIYMDNWGGPCRRTPWFANNIFWCRTRRGTSGAAARTTVREQTCLRHTRGRPGKTRGPCRPIRCLQARSGGASGLDSWRDSRPARLAGDPRRAAGVVRRGRDFWATACPPGCRFHRRT